MIDLGKKNVLGVYVHAVDYDAAVSKVISAAENQVSFSVSALAVHGVMTGVTDPVHQYRLNQLDLITPDGQPVRWALNWLYDTDLSDRVYGPELMYRVCEQAAMRSIPIFLFGSTQPVINALEANLLKWFPDLSIAGSEPSQFRRLSFEENSALMNRIRSSGAALTFIGLGCPRQEIWVCENQEALSMPIMAVGAAFDFHAGSYGQAPGWMQRAGLEWLYRFITEPRRLWRRYLLLNPYYLWLLLSQKLGIRDFNPMDAVPPTEKLRFG